jgi:hypothetical protein
LDRAAFCAGNFGSVGFAPASLCFEEEDLGCFIAVQCVLDQALRDFADYFGFSGAICGFDFGLTFPDCVERLGVYSEEVGKLVAREVWRQFADLLDFLGYKDAGISAHFQNGVLDFAFDEKTPRGV